MPYTIQDWFHERAQVHIRVPAPPGSGQTWYEAWVPFSFFDEGALAPMWVTERTQPNREAIDFIAHLNAFDED